jgi:hypothetical protein
MNYLTKVVIAIWSYFLSKLMFMFYFVVEKKKKKKYCTYPAFATVRFYFAEEKQVSLNLSAFANHSMFKVIFLPEGLGNQQLNLLINTLRDITIKSSGQHKTI